MSALSPTSLAAMRAHEHARAAIRRMPDLTGMSDDGLAWALGRLTAESSRAHLVNAIAVLLVQLERHPETTR